MVSNYSIVFPNFNIYSTPLLVLVLQGLIFTVLLGHRYYKKRNITDLVLALLLLTACYQRTTYTIGFMSWYDTFRNTKINYFLWPMGFLFGPLLYFYVKSIISVKWSFKKNDYWHFIPIIVFAVYRFGMYLYDVMQPGFGDTQNGVLMQLLNRGAVGAIFTLLINLSMILYIAFTIQIYYQYRSKIKQYFSNTFDLEINWLRIFLFIYAFLYLYGLVQVTLSNGVLDLDFRQKWWLEFLSALAIIIVGIKGYFTPIQKLQEVSFESVPTYLSSKSSETDFSSSYQTGPLIEYIESETPYLESDLTLGELAKAMNKNTSELSELINNGIGLNFNDFINSYRVSAFKAKLNEGAHLNMSLVGLAYDCGFNSKATFNRVFKKLEGVSPSEYIKANNFSQK